MQDVGLCGCVTEMSKLALKEADFRNVVRPAPPSDNLVWCWQLSVQLAAIGCGPVGESHRRPGFSRRLPNSGRQYSNRWEST